MAKRFHYNHDVVDDRFQPKRYKGNNFRRQQQVETYKYGIPKSDSHSESSDDSVIQKNDQLGRNKRDDNGRDTPDRHRHNEPRRVRNQRMENNRHRANDDHVRRGGSGERDHAYNRRRLADDRDARRREHRGYAAHHHYHERHVYRFQNDRNRDYRRRQKERNRQYRERSRTLERRDDRRDRHRDDRRQERRDRPGDGDATQEKEEIYRTAIGALEEEAMTREEILEKIREGQNANDIVENFGGNHNEDIGNQDEDIGNQDEDGGNHDEDGGNQDEDGGNHDEDGGNRDEDGTDNEEDDYEEFPKDEWAISMKSLQNGEFEAARELRIIGCANYFINPVNEVLSASPPDQLQQHLTSHYPSVSKQRIEHLIAEEKNVCKIIAYCECMQSTNNEEEAHAILMSEDSLRTDQNDVIRLGMNRKNKDYVSSAALCSILKDGYQVLDQYVKDYLKNSCGNQCQICYDTILNVNNGIYCGDPFGGKSNPENKRNPVVLLYPPDDAHYTCKRCYTTFVTTNVNTMELKDGGEAVRCFERSCARPLSLSPINNFLKPHVKLQLEERVIQEIRKILGKQGECCKECSKPVFFENDPDCFICPYCNADYCRKCGVVDSIHRGKSCQQLETPESKKALARNKIETMLSNAVMVLCSKCNVFLLKETDDEKTCNKMTCPWCKVEYCYTCKRFLEKGYKMHFCYYSICNGVQFCPENCGRKCPLYPTMETQDEENRKTIIAVRDSAEVQGDPLLLAAFEEIYPELAK